MNIKNTLKYAEEPDLDGLAVVKKAYEWMIQSRERPVPKMLFGEFWLEGELGVLAAGSGAGKSLLAVQIAESIARGHRADAVNSEPSPAPVSTGLGPLKMNAPAQKVLYLDLKLSEKQFEMRYAGEYDANEGEFLKDHHKFSSNFHRVEVDLHAKLSAGYRSFDEVLPRLVERLADKYKARVVIIDSLTYLQRSVYGYRETYTVMKELDSLKRRLGLSILVLARTASRDASRPAAIGSSSALLGRFADSVFTIGQSRIDPAVRYIKHLNARSTEKVYDSSYVPSFRVARLNGNFLGFEHLIFGPESEHLDAAREHRDWPTILKVNEMTDEGMSIRRIAAELELPKSTVHRYQQIEVPPEQIAVARAAEPFDPTTHEFYFPGSEEYDEAGRDPRFHNIYDREGEEFALLRTEAYLIELARAKAQKEFKKTGSAPKLAEMLARLTDPPARADGPHETNGHADPYEFTPGTGQTNEPDPFPGLRRSIDAYGNQIYIESETESGKPRVWYKFDKKGRKIRRERTSIGVESVVMDD